MGDERHDADGAAGNGIGVSPLALPEQPPMDDAAGGPQADDGDE